MLFFVILLVVVSGFYMDEETLATIGSHAKAVHKAAKELASKENPQQRYQWLAQKTCAFTGFWCDIGIPPGPKKSKPPNNPGLKKSKPPNRRRGVCFGLKDDALKACKEKRKIERQSKNQGKGKKIRSPQMG
jgi:hypothetical protein